MKSHCIRCKERISEMDFYMETKQGRICSSCLVKEQRSMDPGSDIKSLFQTTGKPVKERSAAEKAADKLKLLSTTKLRYSLQ